jgi:cytochrome bd-type quinol oxidase subunit 2
MNPEDRPRKARASFRTLLLNVAAYAALVVYTIWSRRGARAAFEKLELKELPLPTEAFLYTPSLVYAAFFLLVIVALIVKEFALADKGRALRLNIVALVAAFLLAGAYVLAINLPFLRIQKAMGAP